MPPEPASVFVNRQKFFGSFFQKRTSFSFVYFLLVTLGMALAATLMPPFQNADEPAHIYRADQISHGQLLCKNLSSFICGGRVDGGLVDAAAAFHAIPFHRENKVTQAMFADPDWGRRVAREFSNTAIYPPAFYLPAAGALAVSRRLGLPVLQGVLAARLATGAMSIAIGTASIAIAGDAAIWLFAVLLLPMSLCLGAAVSQDGPMLAATALAAALCRRAGEAPSPRRLAAIAALLALVGMARPPYAAFALVLLGLRIRWFYRVAGLLCVLAATAGWALLNANRVHVWPAPGAPIDPGAQLRGMLAAPGRLPGIMAHTWHHLGPGLLGGFIGEPGWLDVDLPWTYQCMAWAMLGVALVGFLPAVRLRAAATALVPAAMVAAAAGMALLLYLTQSSVGAAEIDGLQGRYFLPPALLLAALPSAGGPRPRGWGLFHAAILAFPLVTIPVTINAIVGRYYLGAH